MTALEFPHHHMVSLHELGTRLLDGRRDGTDLRTIARDLLGGFFDLCMYTGLDGLLSDLAVTDWASLAEHAELAPRLVAQLETIDLDRGGPRNVKPRQLAESLVAALGLTVAEQPNRTVTLDHSVRAAVVAGLASVLDVELAVPHIRDTIIAMAREHCAPDDLVAFNRIVAQLDDRGMSMVKQPKVPLEAARSVQRVLTEARNTFVDRVARAAIDRAQEAIARVDADAAARLDLPVTLRLTPRDVAILRACDSKVPKTAAAVTQSLLDSMSEVAQLAWRLPEQPVRPYATSQTFAIGDLIEHPKFGRGTVISGLAQRIDVEFADGKHTLVHVPGRK